MIAKRTKSWRVGELGHFAQQYARKARAGVPNDGQYDRKLEKKMKRFSPSELSDLLSDEVEEPAEQSRACRCTLPAAAQVS